MKAPDYDRTVALAHACELDWAAWALGFTSACTCTPYSRDGSVRHEAECRGPERLRAMQADHGRELGEYLWKKNAVPPLTAASRCIEDLSAPYLADCERRGMKPGPLPAMKWTSIDGRVDWGFFDGHPYIRVAGLTADWKFAWCVRGCGTADDLALMSTLVTAAHRAAKTVAEESHVEK